MFGRKKEIVEITAFINDGMGSSSSFREVKDIRNNQKSGCWKSTEGIDRYGGAKE